MQGPANPDSRRAVKRRKDEAARRPQRHGAGLGDEIEAASLAPSSRQRAGGKRNRPQDEDELLTRGLSNKVLLQAREQRDEIEEEERRQGRDGAGQRAGVRATPTVGNRILSAVQAADSDEEAGDSDDEAAYEQDVVVNEEDERALEAFMRAPAAQSRTLADLIGERLRAAGAGVGGRPGDSDGEADGDGGELLGAAAAGDAPGGMDPAVVEVYRGVGTLLSRYTSGKVPKAFKIIPALANWEEVLYLTGPDQWTPHATAAATRLFASNLNAKMAQRFFNLVLLPAVRGDIARNRRLHFTLFCALKKATYKPAAWFKGILLPLCAAGNCTLREAVILSSVINRSSLPMLHSAAALLKIADMEYSGTNSFFIRVLLDKKYALPYKVLDSLVEHFLRFQAEPRALPVVWHQALLCFVQRYKRDITAADKQRLHLLCAAQKHYLVTPELLRELQDGVSRGQVLEVDMAPRPGAELRLPTFLGTAVHGRPGEDVRAMPPVIDMDD